MLCRDRFSGADRQPGQGNYLPELWAEMHRRLTYLIGTVDLYSAPRGPRIPDQAQVVTFLTRCTDAHFLDAVEYVFQVEPYWRLSGSDENEMVGEVNQLLQLDDLPYAVTRFVREIRREAVFGREREVQALVCYPKVILRDQQIPHAEAIAPAIQLLQDKGFSSANLEFLGALEDHRRGKHADCLTKCGSAFESTMKLICEKRRWPYQQSDAAGPLLRIILTNCQLDPYLEQPLLTIATLRNRLSSAHGAGAQVRAASPARARYAINATAAAILLLVEECLESAP